MHVSSEASDSFGSRCPLVLQAFPVGIQYHGPDPEYKSIFLIEIS